MNPAVPNLVRQALLAVALATVIGGCASRNAAATIEAHDPLQPVNRVVYKFNDIGDRYLLRPVAVGYQRSLPSEVRGGIRNVFSNLLYPITIINDFLQGKFRQSGHDSARFLINSTVGLAGLFDPAVRIGLVEHEEDLDQTLAVWGVGEGPYLVIPVLGPRTLRHLFGEVVEAPLSPFYNDLDGQSDLALGALVLNQVDIRSSFLDTDKQVFEAYDPYIFVRDAYLQNRRYRALDGNVPEDNSYLDDPESYETDLDVQEPESGDEGDRGGNADDSAPPER